MIPFIQRLFISEGFMHITKFDIKKIKKLEFEPYCTELNEAVKKVIADNTIAEISKIEKLVWFVEEVGKLIGISSIHKKDIIHVMRIIDCRADSSHPLPEEKLIEVIHKFYQAIANH